MNEEWRILITAFEPFDGRTQNLSQLMLEALLPQLNRSLRQRIDTLILPVVFDSVGDLLRRKLSESRPELVVALGEASGENFRLETRAINLDDSPTVDNCGVVRSGVQIRENGPEFIPTALPIERLHSAFVAAGIPVEFSDSAGGFLCNHAFYHLMSTLPGASPQHAHGAPSEGRPFAPLAGFIHVPRDTPLSQDADRANWGAQALKLILEVCQTFINERRY